MKTIKTLPLVCTLLAALPGALQAEPFLGEIRWFGGNFAPRGYAFCNGQLLPIAQHSALFSLLGTIYGGDGRTTFGLPDMRGRSPLHFGSGPGLTARNIGSKGGTETNTLTTQQLPTHTHALNASSDNANSTVPNNRVLASANIYSTSNPNTALSPAAVSSSGGGQPHNNMQPYLGLNCIIAITGIFPSRS